MQFLEAHEGKLRLQPASGASLQDWSSPHERVPLCSTVCASPVLPHRSAVTAACFHFLCPCRCCESPGSTCGEAAILLPRKACLCLTCSVEVLMVKELSWGHAFLRVCSMLNSNTFALCWSSCVALPLSHWIFTHCPGYHHKLSRSVAFLLEFELKPNFLHCVEMRMLLHFLSNTCCFLGGGWRQGDWPALTPTCPVVFRQQCHMVLLLVWSVCSSLKHNVYC